MSAAYYFPQLTWALACRLQDSHSGEARGSGADAIQRQSQITQAAHQMLASSSDDSEDSEEEGHEWQHQQAGIPKPFNGNSAVPRLDMSKVCMPDCWRKNTAIHASVCVSQLKLASSIDEPQAARYQASNSELTRTAGSAQRPHSLRQLPGASMHLDRDQLELRLKQLQLELSSTQEINLELKDELHRVRRPNGQVLHSDICCRRP